MVFSLLPALLALLAFNPLSSVVNAVPVDGLSHQARDLVARASDAPHFVVYGDKSTGTPGPPSVDSIKGFNVFALSFWLTNGPFDKAQEWVSMSPDDRASVKSQYKAAGISLIVSLFGSTDIPTTSGADPTALAGQVVDFVKQYDLDGVDVDYEDFDAIQNGTAESWLADFTKALRSGLPQGQYIISHAPVAPWFSSAFSGKAYQAVHQQVGDLIDFYNIQFYNQGASEYTTCDGLLNKSSSMWPQSSVFEIAAFGVPLEKILIGKPASAADASNGFIDPGLLATCVQQAKSQNWNGGVMVWQSPTADSTWIGTVRGQAFPV